MAKEGWVYILASARNGTLYTGVTSDLIKRIYEHRSGATEGFTKKHKVHRLVYFEEHETVMAAIVREKAIKKWRRAWNLQLIESVNPECIDLYTELLE